VRIRCNQHRRNRFRVEHNHSAEVRTLRRCLNYSPHHGTNARRQQIVVRIVVKTFLAVPHLFSPLHNCAERRMNNAVCKFRRVRRTPDKNTGRYFAKPIFGEVALHDLRQRHLCSCACDVFILNRSWPYGSARFLNPAGGYDERIAESYRKSALSAYGTPTRGHCTPLSATGSAPTWPAGGARALPDNRTYPSPPDGPRRAGHSVPWFAHGQHSARCC
jgi:hypothetical protein